MPSHVLGHSEAANLPISSRTHAGLRLVEVMIPASAPESANLATSEPAIGPEDDGLGALRGLRSALLIQAAAALVFYGIWHFWHLLR
jgi:hypothetical protein